MSAPLSEQNTSTKYQVNSPRRNDSAASATMMDLSGGHLGTELQVNDSDSIESPTVDSEENLSGNTTAESNDIIGFDQLDSIINGSIGQLTELTPMIIDQELQPSSVSLSIAEAPSSFAACNVPSVISSCQSPSNANDEIIGDLDAENSWSCSNVVTILCFS